MEAEAHEALFLWWVSVGGERVKLRVAFEEWIESVDGIRWGSIKRAVKEDCFLSCTKEE